MIVPATLLLTTIQGKWANGIQSIRGNLMVERERCMKNRVLIISLGVAILLAGCGPSMSLEEKQQRAEAQYKLGIAELYAGKYPDALIAFEKSREWTPNDPKIYNALGLIYFRQQKYSRAIEAFQKTLQLDPNFADAHNNLGKVYAQMGNWDKAIMEYREALANSFYRTPELAHYNLGEALLAKGDNINAVKEFHSAIQIRPKFSPALNKYGIALYRMNRNQEAIKRLTQAIESAPDFIDPYLNLGIVYMKLDNRPEAVQQFRFVVEHSLDETQILDAERYLEMLE